MWPWRRRSDEDFAEEIGANVVLETDRFIAEGVSPEEARRAALRAFGNVTRAGERFYWSRRVMWWDDVLRDMRHSLRMWTKNRGFASVAIASIALGVGAATAVFSAVEGLLLNPYPYPNADRLVVLSQADAAKPFTRTYLTTDEARSLSNADSLAGIGLWDEFWMWTKYQGVPDTVYAGKLSSNAFEVLGVEPFLGRTFAGDLSTSTTDQAPVAVLSYRHWRARYAGSEDVLGRGIQLDDKQHTIVGVMPERFRFLNADVYVPMPQDGVRRTTLLRVRSGVSTEEAVGELQALLPRIMDRPSAETSQENTRVRLTTLRDEEAGSLRGVLGILFGAVGLLLLIGCANVSILLIGRGVARRSELSVRHALGASQGRILRQLLTESVVISVAGGLAGLGVAYGLLTAILNWIPPGMIPRAMEIGINSRVLAFVSVLAVLVGIAAGIAPAFSLSRSRFGLVSRLGGRSLIGSSRTHLVMIIVQTAATIVLLAGAGAAIRTFLTLVTAPLGYSPDHVSTFGITLKDRTVLTWVERATYYDRIRAAVASVPGVSAIAVTGPAPTPPVNARRSRLEIPGVSEGTDQVAFAMVSAGYFSALKVPLRLGRTWTDMEDVLPAHVGVINETMARRYWPSDSPIGQRIRLGALRPPVFGVDSPGNDQWIEIVGVVGDVRNDGLRKPVLPGVYVPYTLWVADAAMLLTRATGPPAAIVDAVKRRIATVNGDQPVMAAATLEERLWENGWARQQFVAAMFSMCAVLALALGAIGTYSVVAFAVARQTRDIGLRIALGAPRTRVLGGILTSAITPITVGLAGGLALVALLHPPIAAWTESSLWHQVSLLPAMSALAVVGCCAVLVPARRATRVDPLEALRCE